MDGIELAERLRAIPALRDLKLVAITGYGQASDRQRTREAGFHAHIVKPVSVQQVEESLRRLLDDSDQR